MGRQPEKDDDGNVLRPAQWPDDAPLDWELSESAKGFRADYMDHRRMLEEFNHRATPPPFFVDSPHAAGPDATATTDADTASSADGAATAGTPAGDTSAATAATSPPPQPNPFATAEEQVPLAETNTATRTASGESPYQADAPPSSLPPHMIFSGEPAGAIEQAQLDAPFPARLFVGAGLIGYPCKDEETGRTELKLIVRPGEDVILSTIGTGNPAPARFNATIVDVFKSGMSEFDSTLVFCPIEELQRVRGMINPQTGQGDVTMLKIKLKDYETAGLVVQRLRQASHKFPPQLFQIYTWEQKRAPLLQAVEIESAILNVLLFLIIAVAGFGILAIFYMIVVEKTRDIGILKALGASSRGVMAIFLTYGLSLGVVGSGVGVVMGLLFVCYINEIEGALSWMTGKKVFDETIYYFHVIPTQVSPWMVIAVALGAMAIAVLASVLPARRASRLHPVCALRYE
jgi:lipoprotein-releasing system permease protein